MSFKQQQARFKRLHRENAAWQLLRSDNAPHTLAFVADLFEDETEVPLARARAALELELEFSRETGIWETEQSALAYLRQWIQAGWLRDFDGHISKTDACEIALRFATTLDQRETHATASHLRIVQDAARDLALSLSTDADERLAGLYAKQADLQLQIDELKAGVLIELDQVEAAERVRELYQLAAVLTGDFRHLEDEIRELDQVTRIRMIESDSRGEVLDGLMEQEISLASSEAGRAFNGFFNLLMDQDRSIELREQLRTILSSTAANKLKASQHRYLSQLMRELSRESDRVFQVRRRTEESLRSFIERGALQENRVVDELLGRLEQLAVNLKDEQHTKTLGVGLSSGNAKLQSVDSWQLYSADAQLDGSITEHQNSREASSVILDSLQSVQILELAATVRETLQANGPSTIGQLVDACGQQQGLEELVAFMRIAVATDAPRLPDDETVECRDRDGSLLRASLPGYLLDARLFPDSLEGLSL